MTKRKTFQTLLWVFLSGIFIAIAVIYYLFNMPHRNISKENAIYELDAKQLISEFRNDETSATAKYLDKTIAIKGQIKSIRTLENHSMVFSLEDEMAGVSCSVDSADVLKKSSLLAQFAKGSVVTFKGRCSGMLMDIQIINCVPE